MALGSNRLRGPETRWLPCQLWCLPDLQGLGGLLGVEENQNGIAGPAGDSEASTLLSVISYIDLAICTFLVCEGTRRLDEQCPLLPYSASSGKLDKKVKAQKTN